jgi:hypothetical protein
VDAFALSVAIVFALVFAHLQLGRARRQLSKQSKLAVMPEQVRSSRRRSMTAVWAFAVAALIGGVAASNGYYWAAPLVLLAVATFVTRLARSGSGGPEFERKLGVAQALLGAERASSGFPPPEAGREAQIEWLRNEWPLIEANAAKNHVDPKDLAALKREVFGKKADREPTGWGFEDKPRV